MASRIAQWLTVGLLASSLSVIPSLSSLAELRPNDPIPLGGAAALPNLDVRGHAKGSVALFKTVGDRDINQTRCMGYGSLAPDHVIDIQKKLSSATFQIKSQGEDTTLVIVGPNNRIYCADDSPKGGKEAGLTLTDVKSGLYRVWVGTFEPGSKVRYTLNIQTQ